MILHPMALRPGRVLPPKVLRLVKRMLGRYRMPWRELWTSYNVNQIQALESALNQNGWSLKSFSSILDFGCGPGRLSQHLCWMAPNAQLFGCDVDAMGVAEAQRLCPRGDFRTNSVMPPLPYYDDQFDMVCAYGVYTNISETIHRPWLKELARVLQPGGVMLLTTHSHEYLRRLTAFSPETFEKYHFPGSVDDFIRSGQGFYYFSPDHWPADYGWAVISREYVEARWPEYSGISLVGYAEGAIETYPEGCQDIIIMAKDPVQRHF